MDENWIDVGRDIVIAGLVGGVLLSAAAGSVVLVGYLVHLGWRLAGG